MYKDLREVREHYDALRDLISQNPGGREDAATRGKISMLCKAQMSGADYLRLQMLIALEGVNTRLFFLHAMRDRDTGHLAHPAGAT